MHITRVIFKNCQAFRDTVIDLDSGVNIIIAPNSTGKSIIFKMIKLSCGNMWVKRAEDLKHCISYGADNAVMLLEFSDGSVGGCMVFANKVVYLFKKPNEQTLSIYTEPHNQYLHNLSIVMDKDSKYILNILESNKELLFVNSSPKTNFALLKMLANNEPLENLIVLVEDEIAELKQQEIIAKSQNCELRSKYDVLEEIDFIRSEFQLNYGSILINSCDSLTRIYDAIFRIETRSYLNTEPFFGLFSVLDGFRNIHTTLALITPIKHIDYEKLLILENFLSSFIQLHKILSSINNSLNIIDNAQVHITEITEKLANLDLIVTCPVRGEVCYFEKGCVDCYY